MTAQDGPKLSFVIPIWNEQEVLPELHRRLTAVADSLPGTSEIIFVDDYSTDGSREQLLDLREKDRRVTVVRLSRNFGHQLALSAGLDYADGDAVITMDGDLQDPPELVPKMVELWREGYDVVYATRPRRSGESRILQTVRRAFYRLLRISSEVELPLDAGDFRLVDRRVADIVRNMREPNRYLRGMFAWAGFRQTGIEYERDPRFAGDAKYTPSRLVTLGMNGILGYSTAPLRIILGAGFLIAGLAFIAGLAAIVFKLTASYSPPGWASLSVAFMLMSGVQLILLGTVGLYVGRTYEQGRNRPLYLVDEVNGSTSSGRRHLTDPADPAAQPISRPD